MRLMRAVVAMCSVAALLSGTLALAQTQQEPSESVPSGGHHAGQQEPTGGGGGYPSSVPLDLPPARDGLPVPVSLVHGGTRLGAAGRGWDVPVFFVRDDTSLAHRRPFGYAGNAVHSQRQVTVSMPGQTQTLLLEGGKWISQAGNSGVVAEQAPNGDWTIYDGNGMTYVFEPKVKGLSLLSRIERRGSAVELKYEVKSHTIKPPSDQEGLLDYAAVSIDLIKVSYNTSDSGSPKHEIVLAYGEEQTQPMALSLMGDVAMVRMRTLDHIDVNSRGQVAGPFTRLSRYELTYGTDADTRQPRLQSVAMSGQEGTDQAATGLPLAQYEYGTATKAITLPDGTPEVELRYEQQAQMPALPDAAVKSFGVLLEEARDSGRWVMSQYLGDVTGDGRADLVYRDGSGLSVARSSPVGGVPAFPSVLTGTFNDATLPVQNHLGALQRRLAIDPFPNDFYDLKTEIGNDTWSQFIDVNGDRRPDFIDANELDGNRWVVYLNTPAADWSHNTKWVRKVYDVSHLATELAEHGHVFVDDHVPLMRDHSGKEFDAGICWEYDYSANTWQRKDHGQISGAYDYWPGTNDIACAPVEIKKQYGAHNFTAFKLLDFNGDGGIDLLLNSARPRTVMIETPPCYTDAQYPPQPGVPGCRIPPQNHRVAGGVREYRMQSDEVLVMFNNRHILNDIPNSEPVVVGAAYAGCGINEWTTGEGTTDYPRQGCEVRDINGDGLADLISVKTSGWICCSDTAPLVGHMVAYLGTGSSFSQAYIVLPDSASYTSIDGMGFRSAYMDLTGDGLLDLVFTGGGHNPNDPERRGTVHIGTGVGFAPAVPIRTGIDIGFSIGGVGGFAHTKLAPSGLYDFDGDGRPEHLSVGSDRAIRINSLVGSSGVRALSAGLLTAVENGHGARTEITYGSAKDDASTPHQLPGPEIVVSKVKTMQSDDAITETTYAYGTPLFGYDRLARRFRSFGYGRSVAVTATDSEGRLPGVGEATARITDTYPLELEVATDQARFKSAMLAGRVREVSVLSGALSEAAAMLTTKVGSDPREIAGTHHDYDGRLLSIGELDANCYYIDHPYAATLGEAVFSAMNTCESRGFLYPSASNGWQGDAAPPSDQNVKTDSRVMAIDDFGRVTQAYQGNDSRVDSDDLCVTTTYATPAAGLPRVLSAVATQTVGTGTVSKACADSIARSVQHFEYDGLPPGQVAEGLVTAQTAERRDALTGTLLETVRLFDADYDARGRLISVYSESDDGRYRNVTTTGFDPFGLVATGSRIEATDVAPQESSVVLDPLTLLPLSATDANGTQTGATYDGFGREILSTVTPPGEDEGALSYSRYLGFEGGSAEGRRVVVKTFDNPVPPTSAKDALGHTATTLLDEFGRATTSVADLGEDYTDDMMTSAVSFDELGRVAFAADPFPTSQDAGTAYGTTFFYNTDGTPKCVIRGHGPQTYSEETDEATERYPTCYRRWFQGGEEYVGVKNADALNPVSPQAGVERRAASSAIGRVRLRETWQGSTLLERSTFSYDPLGNVLTHARAKVGSSPLAWVESSFVHDSFGQVLQIREPDTLTRTNRYSHWGEPVESSTEASSSPAEPARQQLTSYDGLGRATHREERNDGVVDPATVYDYVYDTGTSIHPEQPAEHVLGRLAKATAPTSEVYFGYDAFGRISAQATRDPQGEVYIETASYAADGALTELGMRLPDTSHALEQMKYEYDSARSLRHANFQNAQGQYGTLYEATTIDAFGRVTQAKVGKQNPVNYLANYADTGRRLMNDATLVSPDGDQRLVEFVSYDALGRELVRRERKNDATAATFTQTYDALGQLQHTSNSNGVDQAFGYDALGNLEHRDDANDANDLALSYRTDNRDRLCRVQQGPANKQRLQNDNAIFFEKASVESPITVEDVGGSMPSDVDVGLAMDDLDGADLLIELVSPDGNAYTLEEVSGSDVSPGASLERTYPSLTQLTGEPADGAWKLRVTKGTGDDGFHPALVEWSMTIPQSSTACNVIHDAHGNIVQQHTPTGPRTSSFYGSGDVRQIKRADGATASFRYDAFGEVQELDIQGLTSDSRRDRRYGRVERRDVIEAGAPASILTRSFPMGSMNASRRGPDDDWVFSIGEQRGNRFFVDGQGQFVQDVNYDAYGKPTSTGAAPNDKRYSREQWNGGDSLAAFGLSHLGARIYDPMIGRFTSPDPLVLMRTAATSNPYAFANNDPINLADPSGMDPLELPGESITVDGGCWSCRSLASYQREGAYNTPYVHPGEGFNPGESADRYDTEIDSVNRNRDVVTPAYAEVHCDSVGCNDHWHADQYLVNPRYNEPTLGQIFLEGLITPHPGEGLGHPSQIRGGRVERPGRTPKSYPYNLMAGANPTGCKTNCFLSSIAGMRRLRGDKSATAPASAGTDPDDAPGLFREAFGGLHYGKSWDMKETVLSMKKLGPGREGILVMTSPQWGEAGHAVTLHTFTGRNGQTSVRFLDFQINRPAKVTKDISKAELLLIPPVKK